MKVKLKTSRWSIEFEGEPELWNETLRRSLGGTRAAAAPEPEAAAPTASTGTRDAAPSTRAGPPAPRRPLTTHIPEDPPASLPRSTPRPATPARTPARPAPTKPASTRTTRSRPAAVAPATPDDPGGLFERLAAQPGRRSEKDTVLASVWLLGGGERAVEADDVEAHVEEHSPLEDVKVRPHLHKHVRKTKLLEETTEAAFRLTPKGTRYVRENFA